MQEKFRRLAHRTLPARQVSDAIAMIADLENLDRISSLTAMLSRSP